MAIPKVNITYGNGNIGSVAPSEDGTSALIATGQTVAGPDKVTIGNAYVVYSLDDAIALGIESTGVNALPHKDIADFYLFPENEGTPLYVMLVSSLVTMEEMLDKDLTYAPKLLDYASGEIRLLSVSRKVEAADDIDGLDIDVPAAMIKGQALAEAYALKHKPFRFIVDGKEVLGIEELRDYTEYSYNRGSIFLGADLAGGFNAAIGLYLGLLASLPVQRKPSRVKNGSLPISAAYFTADNTTENRENQWETISNKGYVFLLSYTGVGGYFFSGDQMATAADDDYSSMARGRAMDKVHRLTYTTFVQELDDDFDTDEEGAINAGKIKAVQGKIESVVNLSMTNKGELSAFSALINPKQNAISLAGYKVQCSARPKAYSSNIDIELNYNNPAN